MIDSMDMPERYEELTEERKQFLLNWIADNLLPIQSFNDKHTSYGIKQWIEGDYFTNGEFKGAMLASGYKVKDQNMQNWIFNVSERSPIIVNKKNR